MAVALAAFPDLGVSRILFFVVKFVVVAGGVVVGWLVAPLVVRLLVRLAFHRDAPRTVQTLSRIGGAILGGFLAYLIPIGGGGSGWGWGGGEGDGPGSGKKDSGQVGVKDNAAKPPKDKSATRVPPAETLAVTMLGGKAVKDDRYYQVTVKGKKRKLTEKEIRRVIVQGRRRKGPLRLRQLEIHFDDNSVDETNLAVTALEEMAEENGLKVRRIID
jgi:hypothetical protein